MMYPLTWTLLTFLSYEIKVLTLRDAQCAEVYEKSVIKVKILRIFWPKYSKNFDHNNKVIITFFFSKLVKFAWKMQNVLNWKKNWISGFYFWVMVIFVLKTVYFHDNSKNKNQKIDFLCDSVHCASFM